MIIYLSCIDFIYLKKQCVHCFGRIIDIINYTLPEMCFFVKRLLEEVDEVVGVKEMVDAEDLEKLKYMHQVCTFG